MELISREQVIATIDSFNVFESRSDQIKLELMIGELPIAGVGTNLAEVGTDCISRRQAIETFKDCAVNGVGIDGIVDALEQLPSAEPDIIRCRNCKFASGDSRICMKFDHSPIGELDFCSFAERREVTT